MSPDVVLTSTSPPTYSTWTSPDADEARSGPATRPTRTSPEALDAITSPADSMRTLPDALCASTWLAASTLIVDDAVRRRSAPSSPRTVTSAEATLTVRSVRAGTTSETLALAPRLSQPL